MLLQEIVFTLDRFWSDRGCVIAPPHDTEVGAGTFYPTTFLRALGPEPWNVAGLAPSRRPVDGRYGDNPYRFQYFYQYQVVLKPSPPDILDLFSGSLEALGIDPKPAIAMSLGVVGIVSLIGVRSHWVAGRVDLRIALVFGPIAMLGTYAGARLSVLVSGATQLTLFAGVMLLAAIFMFRDRPESREIAGDDTSLARWILIGVEGLAVGILTGLVGVGGGFLIVPALVMLVIVTSAAWGRALPASPRRAA